MITKVKTLLEGKEIQEIVSVTPSTSVIEALAVLEKYRIGAVLVMEDNELKGIFSERDYARKGIIKGRKAKSTLMSEVMTANVITAKDSSDIRECMELMSTGHFRHLPVVTEDGKVVGVLSIGDIVNGLILEQRNHINFLENYISGSIAG
ncbi:CBS domain-containing protein [Arcticibacterium luteifluviistationis]|uniref:Histidine kinase n=1 Tax=Arcticibacterium luteifluviistationis TaxID=1784714 RepID=A0A2Z4G9C3_9BACT|nr:CBS domain-containing protein [Arcticibacterium luteifluviistationis]AWV97776.1 histidine kinase [Arcticibacterium luteifluviistationis]